MKLSASGKRGSAYQPRTSEEVRQHLFWVLAVYGPLLGEEGVQKIDQFLSRIEERKGIKGIVE